LVWLIPLSNWIACPIDDVDDLLSSSEESDTSKFVEDETSDVYETLDSYVNSETESDTTYSEFD
jgi:hypothetical protein